MRGEDSLTLGLVALALLGTGTAAGICLSSVADGATTVTVTPPPVTVTAPPVTVRVTERATRSHSRGPSPRPSSTRTTAEGTRGGLPASDARVSDYQNYARALVPADQWSCLKSLWTRESHWNPTLVGALVDGVHVVGIPQLRGLKVTDGWRYQIKRGLTYIGHRYGSPCAAWATFGRQGWY